MANLALRLGRSFSARAELVFPLAPGLRDAVWLGPTKTNCGNRGEVGDVCLPRHLRSSVARRAG